MKHLSQLLLAAFTLVLAFALFGCGDGGSLGQNGLGTPGGPGQPINDGGIGLTGRVTDSEGNGIADVFVMATDGTNTWETQTDGEGNYTLSGVPSNDYMLGFYRLGYATAYVRPTVEGGKAVGDAVLTSTGNIPVALPVISVNMPVEVSESGMADISGTITNLDAGSAIISVNGFQSAITVEPDGSFENIAVLQPGENVIYLWADNGLGTTKYQPFTLQYTPSGDVFFRVTLTWDGSADIDLHTWGPDPERYHSSYQNETIPTGTLDVDNVDRDGPENFTCTTLAQGRYRVALDAYRLREDGEGLPIPRNATVKVSVFRGPNAGQTYTFGPRTFTEDDGNSVYPVTPSSSPAWWRPCDIVVAGDVISVVAPDNTELQESDANFLTRARAKK